MEELVVVLLPKELLYYAHHVSLTDAFAYSAILDNILSIGPIITPSLILIVIIGEEPRSCAWLQSGSSAVAEEGLEKVS